MTAGALALALGILHVFEPRDPDRSALLLQALFLGITIGVVALLRRAAARRLGWRVHDVSLAMFAATIPVLHRSAMFAWWDSLTDRPTTTVAGLFLLAVGITGAATLAFLYGTRRAASEFSIYHEVRGAIVGILSVALLQDLLYGDRILFDGQVARSVVGPMACAFIALGYVHLRRWPGRILLWPMGGLVTALACKSLAQPGPEESLLLHRTGLLASAAAALLPALVFEAARMIHARRHALLTIARVVARHISEDCHGDGSLQLLERRRDRLGLDLGYVASAAALVYFASSILSAPSTKIVGIWLAITMIAWPLILFGSILGRLFLRRRARLAHSLLVAAAVALFSSLSLHATVSPTPPVPDPDGPLAASTRAEQMAARAEVGIRSTASLTLHSIGVPIALLLGMRWTRRLRIAPGAARYGLAGFAAVLVANGLFSWALGEKADVAYRYGLSVGDTTIFPVLAAALLAYVAHRTEPGAVMMVPIAAVAAGWILRTIVNVELLIGKVVQVDAGWGEFLLASVFGALLAVGAFLAKRIWIDRDASARARAVRIRGAVLIIHGIAPLLLILAVLGGLYTFVERSKESAAQVKAGTVELQQGADRVAQHVAVFSDSLETRIRLVESTLRAAKVDIDWAKQIVPQDLATLGEAAFAQAKSEAESVVSGVTQTLDSAFTLPDLQVGLFKFKMPSLGIGTIVNSALQPVLSSIFGTTDLAGLLDAIVLRITAQMEASFGAQFARLTYLRDQAIAHRDVITGAVQTQLDEIEALRAAVELERKAAYVQLKLMVKNITNVLYHLLTLMMTLLAVLFLYILWKALNAIGIMAERVRRGWFMLVHEAGDVAH